MKKLKTLNLKKRDGSQDDTMLDDMEGTFWFMHFIIKFPISYLNNK